MLFAGRFALDEVVAEGGTGAVWKARDRADGTAAALKFFANRLCTPAVLETRRNLLQALRQCRHPAVVAAEEIVVSGECAAIVMPWVDGVNLARASGRDAHSIDEISPWFAALLGALEEVHARGLVHGSLHPGLIFPQDDDVRIVGWETNAWLRRLTAQAKGAKLRLEGRACLSPAVRRGEPPTAADDIYAVGAILHLLLTGSPAPLRDQDDDPVPVLRHRADIEERGADRDEVWKQAAQRCLQPAAADRFASVRALRLWLGLEDLTRVLADAAPIEPAHAPAPRDEAPVTPPAPEPEESRDEAANEEVVASNPAPDEVGRVTQSDELEAAPPGPPEPLETKVETNREATAVPPSPSVTASLPMEPAEVVAPRTPLVERNHDARESAPAAVVQASWARPAQLDPISTAPLPIAEQTRAVAAPAALEPAPAFAPEPVSERAAAGPVRAVVAGGGSARNTAVIEGPPPPMPRPLRVPPGSGGPERPAAPSWHRDRPAPPSRPVATPAAPQRAERVPVRGVFMLRTMLVSITLLTIASGGWLVWQIVEQRYPEFADSTARAVRSAGAALLEKIERYRQDSRPSSGADAKPDAAGGGDGATSPEFHYGIAHAPPAADVPVTASVVTAGDSVRVQQPLLVMPASGSALEGGIFDLAHVDAPPRPVAADGPTVAREVLARTAPGHVEVVVVIDRSGQVVSADARSASDADLIEPCLDAARRWRFEPATRGGRAVAVRATVPLAFRSP